MKHTTLLILILVVFFPIQSSFVSNNNGGNARPRSFHPNLSRLRTSSKSDGKKYDFKNHVRPSYRDIQLCQQLANCRSTRGVFDVLRPFVQNQTSLGTMNMSTVCLCTAFHRIAKDPSREGKNVLRGPNEIIIRHLISAIQSVLHQDSSSFECRHIANIAWAAARLHLGNRVDLNGSDLFSALARETKQRIKAFR
jgi:hypothetical protein